MYWNSFFFGKGLDIAKAHVCHDALCGAKRPTALMAGVSLVSILQAGDWARVSTPARHYFSAYITTTNCYQDSVQLAVLDIIE